MVNEVGNVMERSFREHWGNFLDGSAMVSGPGQHCTCIYLLWVMS